MKKIEKLNQSQTEHHTMMIPQGDYEVKIQMEFDHVRNVKREVID